jgi:hypothetical protein
MSLRIGTVCSDGPSEHTGRPYARSTINALERS